MDIAILRKPASPQQEHTCHMGLQCYLALGTFVIFTVRHRRLCRSSASSDKVSASTRNGVENWPAIALASPPLHSCRRSRDSEWRNLAWRFPDLKMTWFLICAGITNMNQYISDYADRLSLLITSKNGIVTKYRCHHFSTFVLFWHKWSIREEMHYDP